MRQAERLHRVCHYCEVAFPKHPDDALPVHGHWLYQCALGTQLTFVRSPSIRHARAQIADLRLGGDKALVKRATRERIERYLASDWTKESA